MVDDTTGLPCRRLLPCLRTYVLPCICLSVSHGITTRSTTEPICGASVGVAVSAPSRCWCGLCYRVLLPRMVCAIVGVLSLLFRFYLITIVDDFVYHHDADVGAGVAVATSLSLQPFAGSRSSRAMGGAKRNFGPVDCWRSPRGAGEFGWGYYQRR